MDTFCALARRKARVTDMSAPVYLFTDADVTPLGSLTVPRDRIQPLLPVTPASPPLVLAWCIKSPTPLVIKARVVTPEQWKNRQRLTYMGYNEVAHAFEFRIDAMPELPRPHLVIDEDEEEAGLAVAAPQKATLRACCARLATLEEAPWADRQGVVEWLVADEAASLTAEAAQRYASSALFVLEQRALCMQQVVSHDLGMDRMRHGLRFLFPDVARARLASSASFAAAVAVPALLNALAGEKPAAAKAYGGDRRALAEMLGEHSSPALKLAAAWIESEDAFVHQLLCDPDEGMAACPQCAPRIMERLEATLVDNAGALPWIRALGLVTDEGAAPLMAPAPPSASYAGDWFSVPRSLAYRLHADRERLVEDAETGAWRARREVIVQELVPFLTDKLAHDTLWTLFATAQAKDAPDSIVHATDRATAALTETRTYLLDTLGRAGSDAVRKLGEWQAHLETPEQKKRRALYPLAPAPVPVSAHGDGSDPLAWYAQLRDEYKDVAAHITDVEDLMRRDLLPPCIKHAVAKARSDGAMHNYIARFRYAAWMADMGYDAAGAMQLVGVNDSKDAHEIGAHVDSVNRHRKPDKTPSFQCKSNMNAPEERVTNCVMRQQVHGPHATGTKLSDATKVAEVRRACTATMPGEKPRYPISHPLDYVVLRLKQEHV